MTPKIETMVTGLVTIAAILGIGVLKTQGWVDNETALTATGIVLGGGLGWAGKTFATTSAP